MFNAHLLRVKRQTIDPSWAYTSKKVLLPSTRKLISGFRHTWVQNVAFLEWGGNPKNGFEKGSRRINQVLGFPNRLDFSLYSILYMRRSWNELNRLLLLSFTIQASKECRTRAFFSLSLFLMVCHFMWKSWDVKLEQLRFSWWCRKRKKTTAWAVLLLAPALPGEARKTVVVLSSLFGHKKLLFKTQGCLHTWIERVVQCIQLTSHIHFMSHNKLKILHARNKFLEMNAISR